jgi:ABC-2 type transport system ATP-binding protein/lipopolysaccharide transport system ATP-binding protein
MGDVIELDGVGKRYRLGEHHGTGTDLREAIGRVAARVGRRPRPAVREIWSLRDVSLRVGEGEALGVVGSNGAGKSTLLKIVCGITTPTEGRCRTRGRVGSLLEVGTGFHGELTGLENVYLNGAMLGMSRAEIRRRVDDIVSFAGLERFMDTPVKRYSSGMYLRLGFAVAAHVEADVLLVDEVLAVGDAEFQRRCLGRMDEVERSGRTVVFVSHDLDALGRLCPRAIWLDGGTVRADGPTSDVVRDYLRSAAPVAATRTFAPDTGRAAQIRSVSLVDDAGAPTAVLTLADGAWVDVALAVQGAAAGLDVACSVVDDRGVVVLDEALGDAPGAPSIAAPGAYRVRCRIPAVLAPGRYRLSVRLESRFDDLERLEHVLSFAVEGDDGRLRRVRLGVPWTVDGPTPAGS